MKVLRWNKILVLTLITIFTVSLFLVRVPQLVPSSITETNVLTYNRRSSHQQKLKTIILTEQKYEQIYESLDISQIRNLTEFHNHNVSHYWDKSGILHKFRSTGNKPLYRPECIKYADSDLNMEVSFLFCHKNELLYSLFRTLYKVSEHTPRHFIKEILVIDDGSGTDNRAEVLEFGEGIGLPVTVSRYETSVGITRCRHDGLYRASGQVTVILDTHMEVADLWLQPLLQVVISKPRALAIPLVHMISEELYPASLDRPNPLYTYEASYGFGTMFWVFGSHGDDVTDPVTSPLMGGGAIVGLTATLRELYPQPMDGRYLWGIENNRLSYRAWCCGEGVWIAPCSQVSHLGGPDTALMRYGGFWTLAEHLKLQSIAEILNLIDAKQDKIQYIENIGIRSKDSQNEIIRLSGIISTQFDYHSKCSKTYDWYLDAIHTSVHFNYFKSPDFIRTGVVRSADGVHCVARHYVEGCGADLEPLRSWDQHLVGFSKNGAVVANDPGMVCWDGGWGEDDNVPFKLYHCHDTSLTDSSKVSGSQKWLYDDVTRQIRHQKSGRCLEMRLGESQWDNLRLFKCDEGKNSQKWII